MRRFLITTLMAAVVLAAGGVAGVLWERRNTPAAMAFCTVAESPAAYVGQPVILRAQFVGASPHGFGLTDPECDRGLGWDYVGDERDPQWRGLDGALGRESVLPWKVEIETTLVGVLRESAAHDGGPTYMFEVDQVGDTDVRPAPAPLTPDLVAFVRPPVFPAPSSTRLSATLECNIRKDGSLGFCLPDGAEDPPGDGNWSAAAKALQGARLAQLTRDGSPTRGRRFQMRVPVGPNQP